MTETPTKMNERHRHGDGFDRTSMKASDQGRRINRDYAAHYFRWGWAINRAAVGIGGKKVLDVGCGTELPLLGVCQMYQSHKPGEYVGVDLNPIGKKLTPSQEKTCTVYGETNFLKAAPRLLETHGTFDAVVCFEVIEHMPVEAGWQLLWWMRQLVRPDGYVLLSTPVYDGHQAANHIHEWTIEELRSYIFAAGFRVERRFGTFASAQAIGPAMRAWAEERGLDPKVFETLRSELLEFHSHDVLATFVAPVIPDASRNNAWKLVPA